MITKENDPRIETVCFSITGQVRHKNEDNFCFNNMIMAIDHGDTEILECVEEGKFSLAVFDGLGGEAKGEMASFIAAEIFAKAEEINDTPNDFMIDLTDRMNAGIKHFMHKSRITRMGATMAALFFKNDTVYGMNMGDSRLYIFRQGHLNQLSKDQSVTRPGHLRRRLVQFLGAYNENEKMFSNMFTLKVKPGDIFIACTDGLTDMLSNSDISQIMYEENDIYDCISSLKAEVERRGAFDNTTVIMAKVN